MWFHELESDLQSHRVLSHSEEGTAALIATLRDSQKFFLGSVDDIPNVPVERLGLNLPYDRCAFAMTGDEGAKAIVIAKHYGDEERSFTIFAYAPDVRAWQLVGVLMMYGETIDVYPNRDHMVRAAEAQAFMRATSVCVAQALEVLNCVNVATEVVDAPSKVNEKRARKGVVPIYSYKVLVLRRGNHHGALGVGSHESPRVHLRRGHIKRRKTGNFWWQPCVVVGRNPRGIVMKDYRADRLLVSHCA